MIGSSLLGASEPLFLNAQSISVGTTHTCAIDLQKKAWCFGDNGSGRLAVPGNMAVQDGLSAPGTGAYSWSVSVPSSPNTLIAMVSYIPFLTQFLCSFTDDEFRKRDDMCY